MWVYEQSTGKLFKDKEYIATGYAGHGEGINNPALEHVKSVGPIPSGEWEIGPAFTHQKTGQLTMRLVPVGHSAYGRDGFLIHGDNTKGDKSASNGCIILARPIRQLIANSNDKQLIVVGEE